MEYKNFISIALLCAGILLIYLGSRYFYDTWTFKRSAIKTVGMIVRINTKLNKNRIALYGPVISFKTNKDVPVEFASNSFSRTKMQIGDSVEVLYSENNPQKAVTGDPGSVWGPSLLMIVSGVLAGLLAVYLFYRTRY